MAPYSSTLAWQILWVEEPSRLQSMGSLRVRYDWATSLSFFHFHALEKERATHSSTLAWQILWTEEPGGLQSMGSLGVGHDWATSLSLFTFLHWRRKWQPTRVFPWRIPGTGEPGGLPSMGSHRVGHDWSDLAVAALGSFCFTSYIQEFVYSGSLMSGTTGYLSFPVWLFFHLA